MGTTDPSGENARRGGASDPQGVATTYGAPLPGAETDGVTPQSAAKVVGSAKASRYRGVNLSGAEFGTATIGTEGIDYTWPTTSEVDYFASKGMNTFRVPFMWERAQHDAKGALAEAYIGDLDALVAHATSKGAVVIIEPQNFARYHGAFVGSASVPNAVFADLWRRLALRYAANPRVAFNLMNEPHDLPTEQWASAANAAIAAIRAAGSKNLVIVPGNGWTGAYSWAETWYGTSNAKAMLAITDPGDNILFEVHQYLDTTSAGVSDTCVSATIGRERLQPFVDWLRANGKRGFVGEFAGGRNATCDAAVVDMLDAMDAASDVLAGWLWWGGGPWWHADYPFTLDPRSGVDAPQIALLAPRLAGLARF